MSNSLRLCALVITLTLSLIAVASVWAQEPTNTTASAQGNEPIPIGTYERFTVLQKIRLGATALVNPSVAGNAAIVYGFEPNEVLTGGGWHQEVSAMITAGHVQFGRMVGTGTNTQLKVDQKAAKDLASTMRRETSHVRYTSNGKFLSTHPTLGGARPSGEWIAWWPEEPKK